ncbi:hypothetical protein FFK22_040985 [Mycobacterium sp. KBS0706]|uniref:hypothetical protein n=1 Tax=Mycobacterium sp. KBS0706 TaxID=2578109 RepID=UPI00110F6B00|nr:hypothetical protein [Mycobacterium sp. KBS0706]TSD82834.1 hypothetical protein FFK22_040985 [Mycobacterium sp. KBS0706]
MASSIRAVRREQERAERRRLAYEKAAQKQAALEAASSAADEYDRLIEALTGAHRVQLERRDWHAVAAAAPPAEPDRSAVQEAAARRELDAYRPGWLARTFGGAKRRRIELTAAVEDARARDEAAFEARLQEAEARRAEIDFARRLVARDPAAVADALGRYTRLGDLPFSVEGLDLVFVEGGRIVAMIDGLDLEDLPDRSVTLLQSGQASVKPLSQGKVLELHRDAICSAAVRAAAECLAALPVEAIEVVMQTDLLDRGSGHIGVTPVLYLRAAAQALVAVNLPRTDAAALVERLGGHFDWSRKEGFRGIGLGELDVPAYERGE